MTYAVPAWAFISNSNMRRLQAVQNRVLCLVGGYDWYVNNNKLYLDNDIPKLKSYFKSMALKLYFSSKSSRNRFTESYVQTYQSIAERF